MIHNYSDEELTKTGIYKITCIPNGKLYIGSASCVNGGKSRVGFLCRLNQHKYDLIKNKHKNIPLQNAYNKYGMDKFSFEILEYCDNTICLKREQYYLDTLSPFKPNGFNICKSSLCNNSNNTAKIRSYNRDNSIINKSLRIPIIQKDTNGNVINEFPGISIAARETQIQRVAIYKCCRKHAKTAGGYIWEYKSPEDFKEHIAYPKFKIKVIDIKAKKTVYYNSILETSKNIDYCKSTILVHLRNGNPIENKYLVERIFL